MTPKNTDKPTWKEAICGHLRDLWTNGRNRNPILRALRVFVVKRTFRTRLLPSAGLTLCTLWLVLTGYCWTAEAAFRQVYPQLRLRNLASAPTQLTQEAQLSLVRQAAASVPFSPDYQWGLADRLTNLAYPASQSAEEAGGIIDDAIRAYIRSLWARPLQGITLLALMRTAELAYTPENGAEPDVLLDLADRANQLAPYNAGLRLEIADWYLNQWPNLTSPTKARIKSQIEATLEFAQTRPEVREQQKQTAATLERLLETEAATTAQTQPPRTPSSPSTNPAYPTSGALGRLGADIFQSALQSSSTTDPSATLAPLRLCARIITAPRRSAPQAEVLRLHRRAAPCDAIICGHLRQSADKESSDLCALRASVVKSSHTQPSRTTQIKTRS